MAYMIPPKVYVGFKLTPIRGWEDGEYKTWGTYKEGMLVPDGTDAAATNRKNSVDSFNDFSSYQTEVWDNDPIEGFQLDLESLAHNRNTTQWIIQDPRGGYFNITSNNLSNILEQTTLVGGLIEGKCAWLRDGTVNKLVLEKSEEYQEAFKQTIARMNRISLRDVSRGDEILLHDGNTVTYLGLFRVLRCNKYHARQGGSHPKWSTELDEVVKRYLYLVHETDSKGNSVKRIAAKSTIKVGHINNKISKELTKKESFDIAFDYYQEFHEDTSYENEFFHPDFVFFAPEKFEIEDVSLDLIPFQGSFSRDLRENDILMSEETPDSEFLYLYQVENPQRLPYIEAFILNKDYLKHKCIWRQTKEKKTGWGDRLYFYQHDIKYSKYEWNKVKIKVKNISYEMFLRLKYL